MGQNTPCDGLVTDDQVVSRFAIVAERIGYRSSRLVNHRIPAEDFTQVALVAALRHVRTYRPEAGASLDTWVFGKMRFACADAWRKELHSRNYGKDALFLPVHRLPPADVPALFRNPWPDTDAALDIAALLAGEPARTRDVYERTLRGETVKEIARALRIHPMTVYEDLWRGKRSMAARCRIVPV